MVLYILYIYIYKQNMTISILNFKKIKVLLGFLNVLLKSSVALRMGGYIFLVLDNQ